MVAFGEFTDSVSHFRTLRLRQANSDPNSNSTTSISTSDVERAPESSVTTPATSTSNTEPSLTSTVDFTSSTAGFSQSESATFSQSISASVSQESSTFSSSSESSSESFSATSSFLSSDISESTAPVTTTSLSFASAVVSVPTTSTESLTATSTFSIDSASVSSIIMSSSSSDSVFEISSSTTSSTVSSETPSATFTPSATTGQKGIDSSPAAAASSVEFESATLSVTGTDLGSSSVVIATSTVTEASAAVTTDASGFTSTLFSFSTVITLGADPFTSLSASTTFTGAPDVTISTDQPDSASSVSVAAPQSTSSFTITSTESTSTFSTSPGVLIAPSQSASAIATQFQDNDPSSQDRGSSTPVTMQTTTQTFTSTGFSTSFIMTPTTDSGGATSFVTSFTLIPTTVLSTSIGLVTSSASAGSGNVSPSPSTQEDSALSAGAKAGIAFAAFAVIVNLVLVGLYIKRRRNRRRADPSAFSPGSDGSGFGLGLFGGRGSSMSPGPNANAGLINDPSALALEQGLGSGGRRANRGRGHIRLRTSLSSISETVSHLSAEAFPWFKRFSFGRRHDQDRLDSQFNFDVQAAGSAAIASVEARGLAGVETGAAMNNGERTNGATVTTENDGGQVMILSSPAAAKPVSIIRSISSSTRATATTTSSTGVPPITLGPTPAQKRNSVANNKFNGNGNGNNRPTKAISTSSSTSQRLPPAPGRTSDPFWDPSDLLPIAALRGSMLDADDENGNTVSTPVMPADIVHSPVTQPSVPSQMPPPTYAVPPVPVVTGQNMAGIGATGSRPGTQLPNSLVSGSPANRDSTAANPFNSTPSTSTTATPKEQSSKRQSTVPAGFFNSRRSRSLSRSRTLSNGGIPPARLQDITSDLISSEDQDPFKSPREIAFEGPFSDNGNTSAGRTVPSGFSAFMPNLRDGGEDRDGKRPSWVSADSATSGSVYYSEDDASHIGMAM